MSCLAALGSCHRARHCSCASNCSPYVRVSSVFTWKSYLLGDVLCSGCNGCKRQYFACDALGAIGLLSFFTRCDVADTSSALSAELDSYPLINR
ncbi:hypothetical protein J6590_012445 [Homalodisca vitripennis]|nr:hypothetical protein J6590_012445 [Homalodisca vitripennis]